MWAGPDRKVPTPALTMAPQATQGCPAPLLLQYTHTSDCCSEGGSVEPQPPSCRWGVQEGHLGARQAAAVAVPPPSPHLAARSNFDNIIRG